MAATVQFHAMDYDENHFVSHWKVFVTGVRTAEDAKTLYCRIVDHLDMPNPFDVKVTDVQGGILFEITKEDRR